MARRITRKQLLKQDEFVEASVEATHWLEEHWRSVAIAAAAAVGIVLVVVASIGFLNSRRADAERSLAEGMSLYAKAQADGSTEELETSLAAFDAAIAKGGGAPVGQVARYYRGAALFRMGRLDEAIAPLEAVGRRSDAPTTLVGSARALLAVVYEAQGQRDQAIEVMQAITEADPAVYPADQALLRLGRLHQANGDEQQARETWQRVIDEFPAGGAAADARRLLDG